MTITAPVSAEVLPGYYIEPSTGAWLTLPWPADLAALPRSIGPQVIAWCESNLHHHLTGKPWRFTTSQMRFLILWYAVRSDGRWLYRSGVKRGAKGTGKDPLAAAMSVAELAGPTKFAGWQRSDPLGVPHRLALVQIAANSEAQAKDVLRVANAMIPRELSSELGIDKGETRTNLAGGSRIELLTNSERSSEGDPATAIFLNESHHMTASTGGQALAGVARRNVAKSPDGNARLLELTNAHLPGEESVAEESWAAWQAQTGGRTRRVDILYDSREAPPHLHLEDEAQLEEGIDAAYADAPWVDRQRIRDEAQDPRVPTTDSIRYYFNALPTNEMAWVEPRSFDACARAELVMGRRDKIALFLDCSKSTDATALMASRIEDGHVLTLGVWQRPHGDRGKGWLAPRDEVDAAVRQAFHEYRVQWFGVDPSPAQDDETEALYWAKAIDQWHRDFREQVLMWATPGNTGSAVLFDMRLSARGGHERLKLFTEMAELTASEIDEDQTLTHDGNPILRSHVFNARRRPNQWGVSLSKVTRDSSKLVDCAVAMVGARLGRRLVLNRTKGRKRRRVIAG